MKTIINNVIIVTMNKNHDIFSNGYIAFEDDKIIAAGHHDEMVLNDADIYIDGKRGIVIPGMVNVHSHLGMIPFRGLGDDCRDRLRTFLFPMEQKAMSAQMVYDSTRYAVAELLLGGVTTVFDMYYYEMEAARAMDDMGIRAIAGETVIDENSCDTSNPYDALEYAEKLIMTYENHPLITGCVSPHATNTCSAGLLKAAHALCRKYNVPFCMHTAEMDYEMQYFKDNFQMSPIEYLDSLGVLDENFIAAHAINVSDADMQLMALRKSSVAHCIGSNAKAAKGVAPVSSLLSFNIPTGLGSDGPSSGNTLDIITQLKLCADFHKNTTRDRSAFPAVNILEMATIMGAKTLNMDSITGSLEPGKQADIVLIETESVNMFPVYDPYSALVYSANSSNVSSVFVAGKCLVKDKKLVNHSLRTLRQNLESCMMSSEFKTYNRMV